MQIQHEEVIFSAVKNRTPLEFMQLLCDEELVIHYRCIISLLTLLKTYNWIAGTAFKHQFTLKVALLSNKSLGFLSLTAETVSTVLNVKFTVCGIHRAVERGRITTLSAKYNRLCFHSQLSWQIFFCLLCNLKAFTFKLHSEFLQFKL